MSIRDCALQSEAFAALKDVYDHRDREAARWRAAGRKVIGELGCDVPDELILAAGMLPVRICADPERPLAETDKYLEYAFDPMVRAQFEKIVDGTYYDQIDALAIAGMENFPVFRKTILEGAAPVMDTDAVGAEIGAAAAAMTDGQPLDALLLECTDLSVFARTVQEAVSVPVYDINSLIAYAAFCVRRNQWV